VSLSKESRLHSFKNKNVIESILSFSTIKFIHTGEIHCLLVQLVQLVLLCRPNCTVWFSLFEFYLLTFFRLDEVIKKTLEMLRSKLPSSTIRCFCIQSVSVFLSSKNKFSELFQKKNKNSTSFFTYL